MKFASFTHENKSHIGVVISDGVVDLSAATPDLPQDMVGFLEAGEAALSVARKAADNAEHVIPLSEVRLEAPVGTPGKILAIGLNYKDHVAEGGRDLPEHQIWFNKQHNAINGPYDDFNMPSVSPFLDYEGELCMVIGRRCKHVPRDRVQEVVAGYMIGNDVSVRDWQLRTQTMQMGKSFDTHAPTGPWLVTSDEVEDPHNLNLKTWVNDDLRQDANTGDMLFDCFDQIAHLTQAFTLDPGDIIFTGTPAGVGGLADPPTFLVEGDVVRIEIEKLGMIENKVAAEDAQTIIE